MVFNLIKGFILISLIYRQYLANMGPSIEAYPEGPVYHQARPLAISGIQHSPRGKSVTRLVAAHCGHRMQCVN